MSGTAPADLTLVLLAAGLGARYGGDKQLDTLGPHGEVLSDYALRDAAALGVRRAVFVVRGALEAAFRSHHRDAPLAIAYAVQRLDDLPPPHRPPEGRTRPWGTAHALLAARALVPGPCLVLNADDCYGPEAIAAAVRFLADAGPGEAAAIAFPLAETLSPHGPVSRAVLETNAEGWLTRIEERQIPASAVSRPLPSSPAVSMNCWALGAGVLPALEAAWSRFLEREGGSPVAECALPTALGELVAQGRVRVRVIPAGRGWLGVTWPADRARVAAALAARG